MIAVAGVLVVLHWVTGEDLDTTPNSLPGEVRYFLNGDYISEVKDAPRESIELVDKLQCWLVLRDRVHHGEGEMTEVGLTSIKGEGGVDISACIIGVGLVRSSCSEKDGISKSSSSCWLATPR